MDYHFMIILVKSQLKHFFFKRKIMLVNLHVPYDADTCNTPYANKFV